MSVCMLSIGMPGNPHPHVPDQSAMVASSPPLHSLSTRSSTPHVARPSLPAERIHTHLTCRPCRKSVVDTVARLRSRPTGYARLNSQSRWMTWRCCQGMHQVMPWPSHALFAARQCQLSVIFVGRSWHGQQKSCLQNVLMSCNRNSARLLMTLLLIDFASRFRALPRAITAWLLLVDNVAFERKLRRRSCAR